VVLLGIRHGRAWQGRPHVRRGRRPRARPGPAAADGQERRLMPPASSDAAGWRIEAELAWDGGWATAAVENGSTLREVARVRFGLGTLHYMAMA
jgi:hypothetical protein